MICSQEDHPRTHVRPKGIAEGLKISQSFVQRMIKRKGIKQFKRFKTPWMSNATWKRRVERTASLLEKIKTNLRIIERAAFQDEIDFPLQIPINIQNDCVCSKDQRKVVPEKNLSHQTNRQSVKRMVSATWTGFGVAKPPLVNKKGLKVNAGNYRKDLKKELFPAIDKVCPSKIEFSFKMVQRPIPVMSFKVFLKKTILQSYIKKHQWSPKSPGSNQLDFYFWNKVQTKVYKDMTKHIF